MYTKAIAILIVVGLIALLIRKKPKRKKSEKATPAPQPETQPEETKAELPVAGAYQRKWILTYNEKDAYRKIKEVTDKAGWQTMTKVRLFDLVEPIKGHKQYQSYLWKIQAKHVDFVLLDQKLVARCIIELDDGSHDEKDRKERDQFVDEVLQSVGYTVIHTHGISPDIQQKITEIITTGAP